MRLSIVAVSFTASALLLLLLLLPLLVQCGWRQGSALQTVQLVLRIRGGAAARQHFQHACTGCGKGRLLMKAHRRYDIRCKVWWTQPAKGEQKPGAGLHQVTCQAYSRPQLKPPAAGRCSDIASSASTIRASASGVVAGCAWVGARWVLRVGGPRVRLASNHFKRHPQCPNPQPACASHRPGCRRCRLECQKR